MEEDLKEQGYRFIYGLTFVVVFCIIPLIFIISNSELSRRRNEVHCQEQIEVVDVLAEGESKTPGQFRYQLIDGTIYTSTIRYAEGDKVCRY